MAEGFDPYTGVDSNILRDVYPGYGYIGPQHLPTRERLAVANPAGILARDQTQGFPAEGIPPASPLANDVVSGPAPRVDEAIPFEPGASSDQPYTIERAGSKGRIRLGPEAQLWAQEWGMTLTELAKYLLQRDLDRKAGRTD